MKLSFCRFKTNLFLEFFFKNCKTIRLFTMDYILSVIINLNSRIVVTMIYDPQIQYFINVIRISKILVKKLIKLKFKNKETDSHIDTDILITFFFIFCNWPVIPKSQLRRLNYYFESLLSIDQIIY
ncbi:hypothetical protein BpHYR1_044879 [Brachionus plicatilis]|uniref:Uncharacterized protein n=1 Tax=Brachionus plicatilis TaxID=10195 RepID=A0A3M7R2T1_BRAPC|nr:hypothetical protein BpHYR1_044879 [Brachionus plicatilis]